MLSEYQAFYNGFESSWKKNVQIQATAGSGCKRSNHKMFPKMSDHSWGYSAKLEASKLDLTCSLLYAKAFDFKVLSPPAGILLESFAFYDIQGNFWDICQKSLLI